MSRTPLDERKLPSYTKNEERANMITHIIGAGIGVIVFVLCTVFSALRHNYWALGSGAFYGAMMIFLYTVSSVYHGLKAERPKKVMQVLDHCTIFALIIGSYAPALFTGVRQFSKVLFIVITVMLIAGTAVCVTFTAIDFKQYAVISMTGYLAIGWAALLILYPLYKVYGLELIIWLFLGGVAYTVGVFFYAKGKKHEYFHMIFHLFILAGSILQFIGIFKFCILQ